MAVAGSSQTKSGGKCVIASLAGVRFGAVGSPVMPRVRHMPKLFTDPEAIAEDIVRDVGTNLVVGLPLGLGKANHVINALYALSLIHI